MTDLSRNEVHVRACCPKHKCEEYFEISNPFLRWAFPAVLRYYSHSAYLYWYHRGSNSAESESLPLVVLVSDTLLSFLLTIQKHLYLFHFPKSFGANLKSEAHRINSLFLLKILKSYDTRKICCNYPKIWITWNNHWVIHRKDGDILANSVDPDLTGSTNGKSY